MDEYMTVNLHSAVFTWRFLVVHFFIVSDGFLLGLLLLSLSCYFSSCLCFGAGAAGTWLSGEVLGGLGDIGDPFQPR